MTKKEELFKAFEDFPLNKENKGIILFMQGVNLERELIANPEGQDKIDYIDNAYNDDLELINNTKIKINGYQFFNNINPVDIHINLGRKMVNNDGE